MAILTNKKKALNDGLAGLVKSYQPAVNNYSNGRADFLKSYQPKINTNKGTAAVTGSGKSAPLTSWESKRDAMSPVQNIQKMQEVKPQAASQPAPQATPQVAPQIANPNIKNTALETLKAKAAEAPVFKPAAESRPEEPKPITEMPLMQIGRLHEQPVITSPQYAGNYADASQISDPIAQNKLAAHKTNLTGGAQIPKESWAGQSDITSKFIDAHNLSSDISDANKTASGKNYDAKIFAEQIDPSLHPGLDPLFVKSRNDSIAQFTNEANEAASSANEKRPQLQSLSDDIDKTLKARPAVSGEANAYAHLTGLTAGAGAQSESNDAMTQRLAEINAENEKNARIMQYSPNPDTQKQAYANYMKNENERLDIKRQQQIDDLQNNPHMASKPDAGEKPDKTDKKTLFDMQDQFRNLYAPPTNTSETPKANSDGKTLLDTRDVRFDNSNPGANPTWDFLAKSRDTIMNKAMGRISLKESNAPTLVYDPSGNADLKALGESYGKVVKFDPSDVSSLSNLTESIGDPLDKGKLSDEDQERLASMIKQYFAQQYPDYMAAGREIVSDANDIANIKILETAVRNSDSGGQDGQNKLNYWGRGAIQSAQSYYNMEFNSAAMNGEISDSIYRKYLDESDQSQQIVNDIIGADLSGKNEDPAQRSINDIRAQASLYGDGLPLFAASFLVSNFGGMGKAVGALITTPVTYKWFASSAYEQATREGLSRKDALRIANGEGLVGSATMSGELITMYSAAGTGKIAEGVAAKLGLKTGAKEIANAAGESLMKNNAKKLVTQLGESKFGRTATARVIAGAAKYGKGFAASAAAGDLQMGFMNAYADYNIEIAKGATSQEAWDTMMSSSYEGMKNALPMAVAMATLPGSMHAINVRAESVKAKTARNLSQGEEFVKSVSDSPYPTLYQDGDMLAISPEGAKDYETQTGKTMEQREYSSIYQEKVNELKSYDKNGNRDKANTTLSDLEMLDAIVAVEGGSLDRAERGKITKLQDTASEIRKSRGVKDTPVNKLRADMDYPKVLMALGKAYADTPGASEQIESLMQQASEAKQRTETKAQADRQESIRTWAGTLEPIGDMQEMAGKDARGIPYDLGATEKSIDKKRDYSAVVTDIGTFIRQEDKGGGAHDIAFPTDMTQEQVLESTKDPAMQRVVKQAYEKPVVNTREISRQSEPGAQQEVPAESPGVSVQPIKDENGIVAPSGDKTQNVSFENPKNLKEINDKFNEELGEYISGGLDGTHVFKLGVPGDLLKRAGFTDDEIQLKASVLNRKNNGKHPLDPAGLKDLPSKINSPMAVFDYVDKNGDHGRNVIVEAEQDGEKLLIGVEFNAKSFKDTVSKIRTLFTKRGTGLAGWVNDGKMVYGDLEKLKAFVTQQQTNSADVANKGFETINSVIQNNPDVKHYFAELQKIEKLARQGGMSDEHTTSRVSKEAARQSGTSENTASQTSNNPKISQFFDYVNEKEQEERKNNGSENSSNESAESAVRQPGPESGDRRSDSESEKAQDAVAENASRQSEIEAERIRDKENETYYKQVARDEADARESEYTNRKQADELSRPDEFDDQVLSAADMVRPDSNARIAISDDIAKELGGWQEINKRGGAGFFVKSDGHADSRQAVDTRIEEMAEKHAPVLEHYLPKWDGKKDNIRESYDMSEAAGAMLDILSDARAIKGKRDAAKSLEKKTAKAKTTAKFGQSALHDFIDKLEKGGMSAGSISKLRWIADLAVRSGDEGGVEAGEVYKQAELREQKLKQDEAAFTGEVDTYKTKPDDYVADVMTTPLVFKLAGAELLPIKMTKGDFVHILEGVHAGDMDSNILKQIPRALTDPVMIFDSSARGGRLVAVLDLKDNDGTNIVVPLALKQTIRDGKKIYTVNRIVTAYGKEGTGWYEKWVRNGDLKYYNKEKTAAFTKQARLQLPPRILGKDSLFIDRIATDADFVKLSNQKGYEAYYQPAYHGSPHKFVKFCLDHIGTGEGGQSHGWGLYFASSKEISEAYRKGLVLRNANAAREKLDGNIDEYLDTDTLLSEAEKLSRRDVRYKDKYARITAGAIEKIRNEIAEEQDIAPDEIDAYDIAGRVDKDIVSLPEDVSYSLNFKSDYSNSDIANEIIDSAALLDAYEKTRELEIEKLYQQTNQHPTLNGKNLGELSSEYENMAARATTNEERELYYEKASMLADTDLTWSTDKVLEQALENSGNSQEAIDWYKKEVAGKVEISGSMNVVDIPGDEVMLNEQIQFSKQPEAVQNALRKIAEEHPELKILNNTVRDADAGYLGRDYDGRTIYDATKSSLEDAMWKPKWDNVQKAEEFRNTNFSEQASRLLNDYGIKGIKYDGRQDGICYVVFDDASIETLETFQQEANRGNIMFNNRDARAIVNLFSGADASTGIHEVAGHAYLKLLETASMLDDAPAWLKEDWGKVKKYLKITDDQNGITTEQHEKFAKAAERYFYEKDTKAVPEEMKGVLQKFKQWLRQIYKSAKDIGVEISPEIKQVFDRLFPGDVMMENAKERVAEKNNLKNARVENGDIHKAYNEAVDSRVLKFIDRTNNLSGKESIREKFGAIDDTILKSVGEIAGVDTTGYDTEMLSDTVRHIENRHGKNGTADQSMKDPQDIARVLFSINNADKVALIQEASSFRNSDSTRAKGVLLSAKINGFYYTTLVVPDTARKALIITGAYKNRTLTGVGWKTPTELTSKTKAVPDSVVKSTIARNDENVNLNQKETADSDQIVSEKTQKPTVREEKILPEQVAARRYLADREAEKIANTPAKAQTNIERARAIMASWDEPSPDSLKRIAERNETIPAEGYKSSKGAFFYNTKLDSTPIRDSLKVQMKERLKKNEGELLTGQDIRRKLDHALEIVFDPKRFKDAERRAGYFVEKTHEIHLRGMNGIEPMFHETGHWVDIHNGLGFEESKELKLMADKMDDIVKDAYSPEELPGEAFATFLSMWVLHPDLAKEFGRTSEGDFYTEFEKVMKRPENAKIYKALSDARLDALNWEDANVEEKIRNQSKRHTNFKKSRPYRDVKAMQHYLYQNFVDGYHSFSQLEKRVERATGKKLTHSQRMSIIAEKAGGSASQSFHLLNTAFTSPRSLRVEGPCMQEVIARVYNEEIDPNTNKTTKDGKARTRAMDDFENVALTGLHHLYREKQGHGFLADVTRDEVINELEEICQKHPQFGEFSYDPRTGDVHIKGGAVEALVGDGGWWDTFCRRWLVETGHVDAQMYDHMREIYPYYIPTFRVMDDVQKGLNLGTTRITGTDVFKRLEGTSDRNTWSALENFSNLTEQMVKRVNEREVTEVAMDMLEEYPEEVGAFMHWAEPGYDTLESQKRVATESMRNEFEKAIADGTIDKESADKIFEDVENSMMEAMVPDIKNSKHSDNSDVITIYDYRNKNQAYYRYQRGEISAKEYRTVAMEPKHIVVSDPMMLDSFQHLSPKEVGKFLSYANRVRQYMTLLITGGNPLFGVFSNVWRDVPQSYITGSYNNPAAYAKGAALALRDTLANTDAYKIYKLSGVDFESVGGEMTPHFDTTMRKLRGGHKGGAGELTAKEFVEGMLDGVEKFNNTLETVPRLVEFNKIVGDPKVASYDAILKAAHEARDVTVNFRRRGSSTAFQGLASIIPFLNVGFQGVDKFARSLFSSEHKTASIVKAIACVTIPSAMLALYHADDEDYDKLSDFYKDNYWILWKYTDANGKTQFFKIPKDREYGWAFSTTIDRAIRQEFFAPQDDNAGALGSSFVYSFLPPTDTIIQPFVDVYANKSWTGSPINSKSDQALMTQGHYDEAYDDTVSGIAVWMARLLDVPLGWGGTGVTPKDIQYMLQQYTGVFGQVLLPLTTPSKGGFDVVSPTKNQGNPITALGSIPKSKMTADPELSNRYGDLFYTAQSQMSGDMASAKNHGEKPDPLESVLSSGFTRISAGTSDWKGISGYLSDARAANNDKSLTQQERVAAIQDARHQANMIYEAAYKIYQNRDTDNGKPQESLFTHQGKLDQEAFDVAKEVYTQIMEAGGKNSGIVQGMYNADITDTRYRSIYANDVQTLKDSITAKMKASDVKTVTELRKIDPNAANLSTAISRMGSDTYKGKLSEPFHGISYYEKDAKASSDPKQIKLDNEKIDAINLATKMMANGEVPQRSDFSSSEAWDAVKNAHDAWCEGTFSSSDISDKYYRSSYANSVDDLHSQIQHSQDAHKATSIKDLRAVDPAMANLSTAMSRIEGESYKGKLGHTFYGIAHYQKEIESTSDANTIQSDNKKIAALQNAIWRMSQGQIPERSWVQSDEEWDAIKDAWAVWSAPYPKA